PARAPCLGSASAARRGASPFVTAGRPIRPRSNPTGKAALTLKRPRSLQRYLQLGISLAADNADGTCRRNKEWFDMRRVLKFVIVAATVAVVYAPAKAHADGYVSPFIGVNFANNSGEGRANFGVDAGGMGAGVIGGELELGYAPSFFGNQGTFGSNYVMDLMGNLIVGIPIG